MIETDIIEKYLQQGKPFLYCVLPLNEANERTIHHGPMEDNRSSFLITKFQSHKKKGAIDYTTQKDYCNLVQKAMEAIRTEKFRKVVLSRIKNVQRVSDLVLSHSFQKLCSQHSGAFCYVLLNESNQLWMGATPEILLKKRGRHFSTIALAGTQKIHSDRNGLPVTWNKKEMDEHQLVSDFIVHSLHENNAQNIKVEKPISAEAGKVVHLKSVISFESDLPAESLATVLHPTPAVCGSPRKEALEFIAENEKHDRDLYTGIVGLNHQNGDADYFVNLRCMQIFNDHFALYVGGGITDLSQPENEWQETEWKSETLMDVLS